MKQHTLSTLLLPEYRRRILGLLLLRPEESLHGREVARRTSLAPGTVLRELNLLASVGLLERAARGNQVAYRANAQCPIYPELAGILRKTSGVADVIATALVPLFDHLRVVFVFGSVAAGRESAGSDLDLMVVGDASFRDVVALTFPVQASIGREINPKVFTSAEFSRKWRTEPFLKAVLSGPMIFVYGGLSDLEQLAGHKLGGGASKPSAHRKALGGRTTKSRRRTADRP